MLWKVVLAFRKCQAAIVITVRLGLNPGIDAVGHSDSKLRHFDLTEQRPPMDCSQSQCNAKLTSMRIYGLIELVGCIFSGRRAKELFSPNPLEFGFLRYDHVPSFDDIRLRPATIGSCFAL